ncbi:hypothetical protein ACH4MA_19360 [Streptomyces roseolus]
MTRREERIRAFPPEPDARAAAGPVVPDACGAGRRAGSAGAPEGTPAE